MVAIDICSREESFALRHVPREANKLSTAEIIESVLHNDHLLSLVCDYIGPKEYLNVCTISHRLARAYTRAFSVKHTSVIGACISISKLCWAFDCGLSVDEHVTKAAIALGNVCTLEYAVECGCGHSKTVAAFAARSGQLACLKWLHENGCAWDDEVSHAAFGGHTNILMYARERGCSIDEALCYSSAAEGGQLECLQFLNTWTEEKMDVHDVGSEASANGHVHIIDYLMKDHDFEWTAESVALAAREGHLDVVKHAHRAQCWDELTCALAADGGKLEVLKYAHEHGCAWSHQTTQLAARSGHLDVLMYARSQGCPWTENVCLEAMKYGHAELLSWAIANGCPHNADTIIDEATKLCLQWARASACPWYLGLGPRGDAEITEWATQNGYTPTTNV